MYQMLSKILFNIEVSPTYYKMGIDCPEIASIAVPGQFIMVRVSTRLDPLLRRPFVIHRIQRANTGSDSQVEILYKIVGKGTEIMSEMKECDDIDLLGPVGNGYRIDNNIRTAVLFGGGIGVAPLLSLAERIISQCSKLKSLNLLLGGKGRADVLCVEEFERLVESTADVEGIGGYKVGFELGLAYSLGKVVEIVRKHTTKPVIYDHQKAGTDIPDTGRNFARVCKAAGVDAVILFPQAGPETERAWIYHSLDAGLKVIVGGRMTHPAYAVSEGGFITDEGALDMYRIAASAGINHFVVPGNKVDVIAEVKLTVEAKGVSPVFYAPGFIAQGGSISDAAKVAGDRFHGIVGRGIYQALDIKAAAIEHASQIS